MRVTDDDIGLVLLEQLVPATILVPWILRKLSNSIFQRCYVDSRIRVGVLAERTMARQRIFETPEND